jgi:hypothetical protein
MALYLLNPVAGPAHRKGWEKHGARAPLAVDFRDYAFQVQETLLRGSHIREQFNCLDESGNELTILSIIQRPSTGHYPRI